MGYFVLKDRSNRGQQCVCDHGLQRGCALGSVPEACKRVGSATQLCAFSDPIALEPFYCDGRGELSARADCVALDRESFPAGWRLEL